MKRLRQQTVINLVIPTENTNYRNSQARTTAPARGRIRCQGGVTIPCRPVIPTGSDISWSHVEMIQEMFVMLCPPMHIHYRVHKPLLWAWMETTNYWNFSKSKEHNFVKNCSIVSKTEFDLDILMINLYTKFHFSMYNLCKENERKLKIIGIFRSPWGIPLSKIAGSYPKRNLINIYLW
jgi:hypothetical protein